MGAALGWDVVAASSLVLGMLLGLARSWPSRLIALVLAFGAGALLVMLVDSMIPEATEKSGRVAGLATLLGFAVAAGSRPQPRNVQAMKLLLAQPGLRRVWELRRDDEAVATLQIPLIRRGAELGIGTRKLAIEAGLLGGPLVVRDRATGEEQARIGREGWRRVLELDGRRTAWKSLGWGSGHGFVGSDDEPLARGKVSSGLMHTNGEIEIADGVPEHEALLVAALAAYLLIRKAEDDSSAAAGSVAATSGGG
jgi:hypothetical protein